MVGTDICPGKQPVRGLAISRHHSSPAAGDILRKSSIPVPWTEYPYFVLRTYEVEVEDVARGGCSWNKEKMPEILAGDVPGGLFRPAPHMEKNWRPVGVAPRSREAACNCRLSEERCYFGAAKVGCWHSAPESSGRQLRADGCDKLCFVVTLSSVRDDG